MHLQFWVSLLIISVTIIGVALGRFPLLRMNRATIALVGAALLILTGAISKEQAYKLIDLNTIVLLFSIMILNVNFRLSGFFLLITKFTMKFAKTPRQLLAFIIFSSGWLSALFLNDTIVLVFTPLIIGIVKILERNPIPYLIALATSANVGSVATIIGNPQNILIGTSSGIPFAEFTFYLAPLALMCLGVIWYIIIKFYPNEFSQDDFKEVSFPKFRIFYPLLKKSIAASILMIFALFANVPTAIAAMGAASLLLVTRRLKPDRVFSEIDWSLLVFFSGLFIVTGAINTLGLNAHFVEFLKNNADREIFNLTIISTVLSNIISNVPAVLILRNFISLFTNTKMAWLTMAMATTFAGNLTLLGSVANLIVAEGAKRKGITLGFYEYLKVGIPVTFSTLILGILWLSLFV